jgi:DNA mismatch repair ATPase MutS
VVLRRLVDTGAIGLVTTHDLALTSVADGLGPGGAIVHFDERLEGDRLAFDYTMRPGVVRQRNALALMRAVGINVCAGKGNCSTISEGPLV